MQDKVKIISESLLVFFIENHWEFFSEKELSFVLKKVKIEHLGDNTLVDNSFIREAVDWNMVSTKKALRCASRLIDIGEQDFVINKINLKDRKVKVKDVIHILKRRPDFIDILQIDLSNTSKNEAYFIFLLGKEYFLNKISIEKHNFNSAQSYNILKAYNFDEKVFQKLSYKKFNNTQISNILNFTGNKFVEFLNTEKMSPIDWIQPIKNNPELYDVMNPLILLEHDVFYAIQIAELVDLPELHHIIKSRISEVTAYGAEKLLIHYLKEYSDIIDFSILSKQNIENIKKYNPEFC